MPKTGADFVGSPEEDIFNIARSATAEIDTTQVRSEYDQTLYEIGRTAFFKTDEGHAVAIQKRRESEGPVSEVEKYDLLSKNKDNDGWTVISTIDQERNLVWNQRNVVAANMQGDKETTAKLFKSVLASMDG